MNNEHLKQMGKRIEYIRKYKMEMSKTEFAKTLNITSQHLGAIEHGKAGLSIEKLIAICSNSKVSSDYILFGKENINNKIEELLSDFDTNQIETFILVFKAIINNKN